MTQIESETLARRSCGCGLISWDHRRGSIRLSPLAVLLQRGRRTSDALEPSPTSAHRTRTKGAGGPLARNPNTIPASARLGTSMDECGDV